MKVNIQRKELASEIAKFVERESVDNEAQSLDVYCVYSSDNQRWGVVDFGRVQMLGDEDITVSISVPVDEEPMDIDESLAYADEIIQQLEALEVQTYIVELREIHIQKREVEAVSEEQARAFALDGKGENLDDALEYSHVDQNEPVADVYLKGER